MTKQLLSEWTGTINIISALIVLLFITALYLFTKENTMNKIFKGPLKKYKKSYSIIRKSILDSTKDKAVFLFLILLSLFVWIIESTMAYILLISLSIKINFSFVVFAVAMANVTKIIGITPGGMGTYEAVMAIVLSGLGGVVYEVALTISILDHLIKKVFVWVVGSFALGHFGLKTFSKKEVSENLKEVKD